MDQFPVVEKFVSINGEGSLAGKLAVFIRFKGCNLQCSYCDTLWANEKECKTEGLSKEEIADYIINTGVHYVTLTGGEPMLQKDIVQLIDFLIEKTEANIEIETNGSVNLSEIKQSKRERVSLTMDYKLPSSNMETHMIKENMALLNKNDIIKFVAGTLEDLECAKQKIEEYELLSNTNVYISPVYGKIDLEMIVEWMKENQLNDATLQVQLHKIIWGNEVKGV